MSNSRPRGVRKAVFGFVTALAFLLILEGGLYTLESLQGRVLFATPWDLDALGTVLEKEGDGYRIAPKLRAVMRDQHLTPRPAAGRLRVVVFGGSVAHGLAEDVLLARLGESQELPGEPEVIVAAGLGFSSVHVVRVWREFRRWLEFDVAVLALGHNEFLELMPDGLGSRMASLRAVIRRSRLCRLIEGGVHRLIRRQPPEIRVSDDPETVLQKWKGPPRAGMVVPDPLPYLDRYRLLLTEILADARKGGIGACMVILPSNPRFPPEFFSRPEEELTVDMDRLYEKVLRQLRSGDSSAALTSMREIQRRAPSSARQRFVEAIEAEITGNETLARGLYSEARDLDRFPTRDTSALQQVGRRLAREFKIPIVDVSVAADEAARKRGWATTAGFFIDNCHFTDPGQDLFAGTLARELLSSGLLRRAKRP